MAIRPWGKKRPLVSRELAERVADDIEGAVILVAIMLATWNPWTFSYIGWIISPLQERTMILLQLALRLAWGMALVTALDAWIVQFLVVPKRSPR